MAHRSTVKLLLPNELNSIYVSNVSFTHFGAGGGEVDFSGLSLRP